MITEEFPDAFDEMVTVFETPPSVFGDVLLNEAVRCQDICEEYNVPQERRVNLICEAYRHAHYDIVDKDIGAIRMDIEEFF